MAAVRAVISLISAIGVVAVAGSGCSSGESSGAQASAAASAPSESADASTTPASPSGAAAFDGETVSGAAYRFVLPSAPGYLLDSDTVRASDGMHQRRWRHALNPRGPFCLIQAVEQPNYTPAFPESSIALWEATQKSGDRVVRNEEMSSVPTGAVAGVDQEMTTTVRLEDDTRVPTRIRQRDFITPRKTLITLITAGPENEFDRCHLGAVYDTFVPTGTEAPTDPPQPSPVPGASGSPSTVAG
jgi:hypothetical protein